MSYEQILKQKDEDGNDYERHVYNGPEGSGYIDIWTKVVDGKTYVKREHVGPEDRESHDWKEVIDGDI